MSRYPQEAAAWRGIQPSLSGWLIPAPCSTRNVTMSTLSSMHAWEKGERGAKWDDSKSVWVYRVYDACKSGMVCVATPLLLHDEGKYTASDRLTHAFRVVWGFWLLEQSQKCLHIAGVPGIPHGIALLMEGCSGYMLLFYTRGKRTQHCVLSNNFLQCDKSNLWTSQKKPTMLNCLILIS